MDADARDRPPGPDRELLKLLGEALAQADPVPEWVVAGARELYALRDPDLDLELATLIADSDAGATGSPGPADPRDGAPVPVRSTAVAEPRLLTFEAGDLAVELEVAPSPRGRLVRGQVVPRQEVELDLIARTPGAGVTPNRRSGLRTDAFGRFELDGVTPGPLRLVCRRPGLPTIATAWVVVS